MRLSDDTFSKLDGNLKPCRRWS